MKIPLLMTASVSTRGMKGACFSDEEREAMYAAVLSHYLSVLPDGQPIVFAENSGWDLARIRHGVDAKLGVSGCSSRVDWIAVDPALCDVCRGKGYNEIILINEAIRRSRIIAASGSFLKVTGRYPVYNLSHFLVAAERHFSRGGAYYGDMKDHCLFEWLRTGWNGHAAYTVLFATTLAFYRRHLADTWAECNDYDDNLIEHVWYRRLVQWRGSRGKADGVCLRFDREPVCGGLQGSSINSISFNQDNDSLRAKAQRTVGNAIRIFTPWFWF